MTTYIFDGTFEGLLTSIFEFYERKPGAIELVSVVHYHPTILGGTLEVVSDETKSKRVWDGLKKKLSTDWQMRFYKTFLSETAESFKHLFDFACYIFDNPKGAEVNYGHPSVIAIAKMDKSVNREKHRMKAFIRFQETSDGIFYAPVEPDYNVLPLIAGFFKNRYADQKWIIYDLKRKYGLYYDLEKVDEITFDVLPDVKAATTYLPEDSLNNKEELYGLLWNDYFRSTNIPARKNMKLHIQHVPKRYWKYLTEKRPH
jgi:probable DNA metabolism protein